MKARRFRGAELTGLDHLGHQRMVLGEALDGSVANQVGAAIAYMRQVTCVTAAIRVNSKVDPACTRLPLSMLRCMMTPSNVATTRW